MNLMAPKDLTMHGWPFFIASLLLAVRLLRDAVIYDGGNTRPWLFVCLSCDVAQSSVEW